MCFDKLEELEAYLITHPEITLSKDAGIAGYISYEGDLCFGVFPQINTSKQVFQHTKSLEPLEAQILQPSPDDFIDMIKICQDHIKEGDIYQANLAQKFLVKVASPVQSFKLYQNLTRLNPAPYAGYMNLGNYEIISSSPESFLKIEKLADQTWQISSSPIKGTTSLDELDALTQSSKEKAEHVMIVDLIRNDLGKICQTGSITTREFLAVHKFANLYHLVSSIQGKLSTDYILPEIKLPAFAKIFQAILPGGSITGTPKKKAMEIIHKLESSARGPYTGIMGYYKFNGEGEFSILIRSLVMEKKTSELSFHSGAGITAGSIPAKEVEEIYLKAEKLQKLFVANHPIDTLIESIRVEAYEGSAIVYNLRRHTLRLWNSIKILGFALPEDINDSEGLFLFLSNQIKNLVQYQFKSVCGFKEDSLVTKTNPSFSVWKLRLIYNRNGSIAKNLEPYQRDLARVWQIKIIEPADFKIDTKDQMWRHKFLPRPALAIEGDLDEMIWLNERREICEGSFTNIFWVKNGQWYTPALTCNILPGIMRSLIIEKYQAKEVQAQLRELNEADSIYLSNALIGLQEARLH